MFSWTTVQLNYSSVELMFSWITVQLNYSSVELMFSWITVQLNYCSVELLFSWTALQLNYSSVELLFSWTTLQLNYSLVELFFSWTTVEIRLCDICVWRSSQMRPVPVSQTLQSLFVDFPLVLVVKPRHPSLPPSLPPNEAVLCVQATRVNEFTFVTIVELHNYASPLFIWTCDEQTA